MATVGRLNVILGAKVRGFVAGMRKSQVSMQKTQASMSSLASGAAKMTAAFAVAGVGIASVSSAIERDLTRAAAIAGSSISKISDSLGGITENNVGIAQGKLEDSFNNAYSSMEKSALSLATQTEFTANEVIKGMSFMAMAGSDAAQTIAAMPAVLQLATAAGIDLGEATDTVTNIMAGFGLTTAKIAEGMQKVSGKVPSTTDVIKKMGAELKDTNNVLIGTFTGSNTSLTELGESFKIAGPVAKTLGVSMEELSATIGVLGNAGIKGGEAGTGLKRAFIAIAGATPKAEKALARFGVKSEDVSKKGMTAIIAQLGKARTQFRKAGKDTEFSALLFEAFGDRAGPKMAALVEQGATAVAKLQKRIETAKNIDLAGFLEAKQLETFAGQFNVLKSNILDAVNAIGKQLLPILAPLVATASSLLKKFSAMSVSIKKAIAVFLVLGTVGSATVLVLSLIAGAAVSAVLAFLAFVEVAPFIFSVLLPVLAKVAAAIAAIAFIIGFVASFWEKELKAMGDSSKKAAVEFSSPWKNAFLAVIGALFSVAQFFLNILGVILLIVEGAVGAIAILFAALWDGIKFGLKGVVRGWENTFVSILKGAQSLLEQFPSLADRLGIDPSVVGDEIRKLEGEIKNNPLKLEFTSAKAVADTLKSITDATSATLLTSFSGEELVARATEGITDAFNKSGRGLGAIMTAVFGDGGDGIKKKIEEALKNGKISVSDLGRAVDVTGEGQKESKESKARKKSVRDLIQVINDEKRARAQLTSEFPALEGIAGGFADKMKNILELVAASGDIITGQQAAEEVIKTQSELVAANLNSITNSVELSNAMDFVRKNAERLGVEFDDVAAKVKGLGFDDISAEGGPSVSEAISKGLFNSLNKTGIVPPEALKAFTDNVGGELGGALSGQAPSIGGIVGGAIGTALGSPQIGATVGQALETVILGVLGFVKSGIEALGNAILAAFPEDRIQAAGGMAVAAIASFVVAALVAAFVTARLAELLLIIASILTGFHIALTIVTGGLNHVAAALALFVAAIGATIVFFATALIAGVLAPLILLGIAATALVGVFALVLGLAAQSPAVKKFGDALKSAVDFLLKLFDPLEQVLLPLAGLLFSFLGVLKPFIDAFVNGLVQSAEEIFNFSKAIAVGLGQFLVTVARVNNAFIDLVQFLAPAFIFLVDILIFFGKAVSGIAEGVFRAVEAFADLTGNTALKADAVAGRTALDALTNTMADELRGSLVNIIGELDQFKVNPDAVQEAVDAIAALTFEQAGIAGDALASLKDTNEAMSEQLTNLPQGFKLGALRLANIVEGLGNTGTPGETFEGTGTTFNITELFVVANDSEQFAESMARATERRAQQQTGSGGGAQFQRGGSF